MLSSTSCATCYLNSFREHLKYFGRKWGKGKVSVSTGYAKSVCAVVGDYYGSAIYYGK